MKYITTTVAFFLFIISAVQAQNEAELVKSVKAKLDKVQNYQASGKMHVDVSFIKAPPSAVTVYYKKPDQFKIIKKNGVSILPKGGVSVNINSLLFASDYTVVPAGTATVQGTPTKVVKLLPLDESSDIVLTTLYIDEKNTVIKKANVTTKESGTYGMDLSFGKYIAWGLPDKVVFSFNTKDYKLPKGVTFEYDKGDSKKQPSVQNKKGKVELTYSNYIINKGVDSKVFAK